MGVITLRLLGDNRDLHKAIRDTAKDQQRSMNALLIDMLRNRFGFPPPTPAEPIATPPPALSPSDNP